MVRTILAVFVISALALAQEDAPASKPLKAGDKVPDTFRAFLAADQRFEKDSPKNRARKMHDLVTDNGLNPVLVAFSRQPPEAEKPVAKLARQMSTLVTT